MGIKETKYVIVVVFGDDRLETSSRNRLFQRNVLYFSSDPSGKFQDCISTTPLFLPFKHFRTIHIEITVPLDVVYFI
jgi:hypothetical protein